MLSDQHYADDGQIGFQLVNTETTRCFCSWGNFTKCMGELQMANNNRWTMLIAVLVSVGLTTPMRGQEFEVDDRVPTGDCPGCIGTAVEGVITAVESIEINDGASEDILVPGGLDLKEA